MKDASRQHYRAECRIGAAIQQNVDVHGGQTTLARHARAMTNDARMPLRGRQHVFDTVVHQLHRPARFPRQQRRVAGDHRRVFFLAAEAAAGLCLNDADLFIWKAKQDFQRAMHVVRTLHRAVNRDAVIGAGGIGHGNHAVRLDIELFLVARAIVAVDNHIGRSKTGLDIALVDGDRLEDHR